jgi:hypothetical protein
MLAADAMQNSPSIQQPSPRPIVALFVTIGFALVLASAFSFVACSVGFLFSGISTIFTVLVTVAVCAVVIPVTALIFRRRQRHFAWRTLFIEVTCLSLLAVGLLSWLQTQQAMQIFFEPAPMPDGVHVYCGRSILFSSYVHFTGPPVVISSLLKSKGLVEVSADPPETSDVSGYSAREQSKTTWGWWQPSLMSKPRFFYLHHTSEAVQGWSEGWWVSGDTNEVYAFISG